MFDPDVPVVAACAGVCLGIVVQARLKSETLFTPLRIYLLSQALTLGVSFLRMNHNMTPFRAMTWVVILGSAITFSVGCLAASLGKKNAKIRPLNRDIFRPQTPITLLFILLFLLLLASYSSLNAFGKWPIFSAHPEIDRTKFVFASTWGMWAFGHETVLLTLSVVLLLFAKSRKLRVMAGFIFAVSFLIQILIGIRNPLLLAFFVGLCLWDLGISRLKTRIIALSALGFMIVFTVIAFLRAKVLASIFSTTEEGNPLVRMFTPIYSYIANNYWNLDHSLEKWDSFATPKFMYGLGLIQGILMPFVNIPVAEQMGWKMVTQAKYSALNTLTYHWALWVNGGLLLTLLFPLLWGWLMTKLYLATRDSSNVMLRYLYAYTLFPVAFGFFSFYFTIGTYSLPIVWIAMLLPFGNGARWLGVGAPKER